MDLREIKGSIRHGFGGVTRLSGRDTRRQFWPFAIFLFFATTALSYLAMIPMMMRMFTGMIEVAEKAARDQAAGIPASPPFGEGAGLPPELIPEMGNMVLWMGLLNLAAVLLLVAAVARRLHDRDRRGYWGLMPLPFTVIGHLLGPQVMRAVMAEPMAGSPHASLMLLNSAAYWVSLAFLIVLLVGEGTAGPNRFGPAPPA
jgi:uncharacterized membrane protein YhaH (DUF805 family)